MASIIKTATSTGDGLNLAFEVDVLGQITAITPSGSASLEQPRHYRYDAQGRLTEVRDANAALIEAFSHDATGNRLSKQTGAQVESYSYPPDSHRLIAIDNQTRAHDAVGNLAARPDASGNPAHFQHGAHNRLAEFKQGHTVQARYTYNAQGERTKKQNGSSAVRYLYTTTGQLIGEYDSVGQPLAEYIYLDTLPVAVFTAAGLGYIETDHLGAPRLIIDAASNHAQWHWPLTGSAFGEHPPNPDPHNTGNPYTFNLRYPGQYYDTESGLHYNYFRDYEPQTGRYIQSDPIGLEGGLNTYEYVFGNPLIWFDEMGLQSVMACANPANAAACAAAGIGPSAGTTGSAGVSSGAAVAGGAATAGALTIPSDSTNTRSRTIPWPEVKRGNWICICRADCNDNIPGNCPEDPNARFAFGTASHPHYAVARKEAKRAATEALGCQPKHIPCRCTGPSGEQINSQ